jgi:hypothetical protein
MREQIDKYFEENKQIAIIWSVRDAQEVFPKLSEEQCWKILQQVERKHDAELGISWTTIGVIGQWMIDEGEL